MSPRFLPPLILAIACCTLQGCTAIVVAGAAAGGYIAHEKGYRVRNPVTGPSQDKQAEDGE